MKKVEAGYGLPVSNKIKASLEGLEIAASLIRKYRTDSRKHGMESLLLLTDDTRSYLESSDMAIRTILFFGGDYVSNMEVLGRIRVDVFYVVLIGQGDDNKDCFEGTDYNNPIYNFALAEPANVL